MVAHKSGPLAGRQLFLKWDKRSRDDLQLFPAFRFALLGARGIIPLAWASRLQLGDLMRAAMSPASFGSR